VTTHAETLAAVRKGGRRVTFQRQIVLDVIETAEEHLDAETIYQRARKMDPKISLATVYRTLAVLTEMGLVDRSYLARTHEREHYEPVGAPKHHHFTCLDCHQVIEFQSPGLSQLIGQLQEELGVQVLHACICVEGYCSACAPNHNVEKERE
jgi:Fe2+ or Zn2+ uptake regulation protein